MAPEQREELKRAAEEATGGEWVHRYDPGNPVGVQHGVKLKGEHGMWIADCLDNADKRAGAIGTAGCRNADYIARANPSAILSLIAQVEALTVPQGWKCAPMNPVVEQVSAGQKADWNAHHVTKIYQEMLEAAPTIPAIPGTKEGAIDVHDFMPPHVSEAVKAGTNMEDLTPYFQAAIDSQPDSKQIALGSLRQLANKVQSAGFPDIARAIMIDISVLEN